MTQNITHYINGEFDAGSGSRTGAVFNPSTGAEIARLHYGDRATLDRAVAIATHAGQQWAKQSHATRQAVMFKLRELLIANTDHIAELIGREHGKTIADAKGEISRGVEALEFACNEPHITKGEYASNVGGGIDVFSMRVAVGVVGIISPFNFPTMVPVAMMAMAIAVGNGIIWKPSERVPSASLAFAQLCEQAGLPKGVLNIVNGDKEIVDGMLEHPGIAAISFVGSTPVGEYIYQKGTTHNKRVAAFTGGKNHMVVMPDADLEAAAAAFVSAGYGSASQRCMAVSLLVPVGKETADRLRELVIPMINALKIGPYNDPVADFGAVISAQSQQSVLRSIEEGKNAGAELVIDGRGIKVAGHENGYYIGPCLFDHVTTEMNIYKQEVFGPVRGIMRPVSFDEAIAITNLHEFGNGAVIFTRDGKSAHRFMTEVEAGMIGVNVPVPLPVGYFNFGGLRRSKFGESHMFGPDAARFYTKLKTVSQRWPNPDQQALPVSLAFDASA